MRLYQGDYARETVYSDDPVAMALHWQSLGARRLHVVDLDGARDGHQLNAEAVRAIVAAVEIPIELGGGIRDLESIERWLSAGVDRVYLGTAAVTDPGLVIEACRRFPGRIAAGADARHGRIAVRGWQSESQETVLDFVRRVAEAGVVAISYTDVSRDGTLQGLNLADVPGILAAMRGSAAHLVLAGGVATLEHIIEAAAAPGIAGVIVGRALYEGTLTLPEALLAAAS